MARFNVCVTLGFEGIAAATEKQACGLAESWCNPLLPRADSIGSRVEKTIQDDTTVAGKDEPRSCVDAKGRTLFVCDGISGGRTWGVYYRKPSGSLKRLVSRHVPLRGTKELAEADLKSYMKAHGGTHASAQQEEG